MSAPELGAVRICLLFVLLFILAFTWSNFEAMSLFTNLCTDYAVCLKPIISAVCFKLISSVLCVKPSLWVIASSELTGQRPGNIMSLTPLGNSRS